MLPGLAMQWRDFNTQLGALHEKHFALGPDAIRNNFAKAIAALLLDAPSAATSRLVAEKAPLNVLAFEDLAALFPEAKFIHVIRDGRDVVVSLLERDWRNPRNGAAFPHVTNAGAAAAYWNGLANIGRKAERAIGNSQRFFVLRYETLAHNPERTLHSLCKFLNASFDANLLKFYELELPLLGIERDSAARLRKPISNDRVGRWRTKLTPAQNKLIERHAGPMLDAFGYKTN